MSSSNLSASQAAKPKSFKALIEKQKRWLFVYISLFLALLALFILIISQIEIEGAPSKRAYENLNNEIYQWVLQNKNQQGLDWLVVENTLTKGIRLTFDPNQLPGVPLFPSARATINPRYLPYIRQFSDFLKTLDLPHLDQRFAKSYHLLESLGYQIQITIRVEGHTDSLPLAKTAFYRNNVELSTFRAYALMQQLLAQTQLPPDYFAIVGYGSFHPLTDNPEDPQNRRVEVYLLPEMNAKQASVSEERG
jgi:chemotaxis protein MotB